MATIDGDHTPADWRTINIDCQDSLAISLAFTGDAKIVSGESCSNGVRVRQYQISEDLDQNDTEPLADSGMVAISDVIDSAIVSKEGQWVVGITGTKVVVASTTTKEVVEVDDHNLGVPVHAIDLSPDSTVFASGSGDSVARVFSINTRRMLRYLGHGNGVFGVKFSPDGQRLATAAFWDPVRIWDVQTGGQLFQTQSHSVIYDALANPTFIPLGWSSLTGKDHVFLVSDKLMGFVKASLNYYPYSEYLSPIFFEESLPTSGSSTLLATNGKVIACASGRFLSFWETFSFSKIGPTITFQDSIISIALSLDGRYLACGRGNGKITVYVLRDFLPLLDILDPTSRLPLMNMSYMAFKPWIEQDLKGVDARLLHEIQTGPDDYHVRANLALVRARLQQWPAAIANAEQSLSIQPSIIGHIAKAVALVGQHKQEIALEAFDIVFCNCGAGEIKFLLLIKAILVFLSGKRENAMTRANDLIAVSDDETKYNCLQVLGNMHLMQGDLDRTIQSFERAQSLSSHRKKDHHLVTILLIFGRSFEEHEMLVRHPLRRTV